MIKIYDRARSTRCKSSQCRFTLTTGNMFAQSRAVSELTWSRFKRAYDGSIVVDSNSDTVVFGSGKNQPSNDNLIHDSIFELNSYRFHRDLWEAVDSDPLSVIYSAVWTLCYTLIPPKSVTGANGRPAEKLNQADKSDEKMDQAVAIEYYTNWYPLILLHKYLDSLQRRASSRQQHTTAGALFGMEQIYKIDREYFASFDKFRSVSSDEAKRMFENDEEEYLRSALFATQVARTPYGAVERTGLLEVSYSPLDKLVERSRLTNLFKRSEYIEPLRRQCEERLIAQFGLRVRLNSWLLPMLRRNEDTSMFGRKYYVERERLAWEQFVMYWQYQKSELLWFVLHTLFALNDLVADDVLSLDLLYFVSDHLERFIECGICREHWLENGKKLWQMYMERYAFAERTWRDHQQRDTANTADSQQMRAISSKLQFTRVQATLDTTLVAPDMFMLQTHNEIQTQNISNEKRLSEAALQSVRADYHLFAMLLDASVSADNNSNQRVDKVLKAANQRTDVLSEEVDVFCGSMLRNLVANSNDPVLKAANSDPSLENGRLRRQTILREKLAYYNLFTGSSVR